MKNKMNRRNFFKKSTQAGMACCAMLMSSKFVAAGSFSKMFVDEKIDPEKLNYCGYTCPEDCKFYIATVEGDDTKKKEAFDVWKLKERYGIEFDTKIAICWRCKNQEKPQGMVVSNCTVRACAIEKGFDSCIQCGELNSCEKDLWKRFPEFYKGVKKMQVKYKEQIA